PATGSPSTSRTTASTWISATRRSPSAGASTSSRRSTTRPRGRSCSAGTPARWTPAAASTSPPPTRTSSSRREFPVTPTSRGTIMIADSDFGDVDIERAIVERAGFTLEAHQCTSEKEVIARGRDAAGILTQYAHIGATTMDSLPRLRVIARYGTGVDIVDVD